MYKGEVCGVRIAVKAMKLYTQKSDEPEPPSGEKERAEELERMQFIAEMKLLHNVYHPNICRLLAVSVDGPQRFVCLFFVLHQFQLVMY